MSQVEPTGYRCPDCGAPLVIRVGPRGRFFACTSYPDCRWSADVGENDKPRPRSRPRPLAESCPDCGQQLIMREGRRGKFIGCSGFPKCRYTRDCAGEALAEGAPAGDQPDDRPPVLSPSGEPEHCPQCGRHLVARTGRRGRFLGCSGYPQCRYTRNYDAGKEGSDPD